MSLIEKQPRKQGNWFKRTIVVAAVAFIVLNVLATTLKVKATTIVANVTSIPKTVLLNRVTIYSNTNSNTVATLRTVINKYP
jgi:hypothetical protein